MTETESIPIPDSSYSPGFKIVSVLSGCFTGLVLLGPGMVVFADDPLGTAEARGIAVFCLLAYLFLQFTSASHQRCHLHTMRARVYFWLLALFPIWSLPVAWVILRAIHHVTNVA